MTETLVNILLAVAFFIACIEYVIQAVRVIKQKSAKDISIWSTSLRFGGMLIVLWKTYFLRDPYLFWGQFILIVIFLISFIIIIKHHKPR